MVGSESANHDERPSAWRTQRQTAEWNSPGCRKPLDLEPQELDHLHQGGVHVAPVPVRPVGGALPSGFVDLQGQLPYLLEIVEIDRFPLPVDTVPLESRCNVWVDRVSSHSEMRCQRFTELRVPI